MWLSTNPDISAAFCQELFKVLERDVLKELQFLHWIKALSTEGSKRDLIKRKTFYLLFTLAPQSSAVNSNGGMWLNRFEGLDHEIQNAVDYPDIQLHWGYSTKNKHVYNLFP